MTTWQRFKSLFKSEPKPPDPLLPVLRKENEKLKAQPKRRKKSPKGH